MLQAGCAEGSTCLKDASYIYIENILIKIIIKGTLEDLFVW